MPKKKKTSKPKKQVEMYSFKITFVENKKIKPMERSVTVTAVDFNAAISVFYSVHKNVNVTAIEAVKPKEVEQAQEAQETQEKE